MSTRFTDQNKVLSDFEKEVWVICAVCSKKAIAKLDVDQKKAQLFCTNCGTQRQTSTEVSPYGIKGNLRLAPHRYFEVELWLQHPFKNEVFYALNGEHLDYLEQYIGADLREHKNRTHFTLLEKLPKFYHEAKNRKGLLAIIQKLKRK